MPDYLAGSSFTCLYELCFHLCAHFSLDSRAYIEDVRREARFSGLGQRPVDKACEIFQGAETFCVKAINGAEAAPAAVYAQALSSYSR